MPSGKLRANYCVIFKLSFTHVLPVSTWCLAFIPSWHTQWRCCKNEFCNTSIFFDVLFLRKWRVVSSKTTCCFFKNDVSLFQNDRSFSMDVWEWKNNIEERENEYQEFYLWKYLYSPFLARTRTRTSQEFLSFCCHKCHSLLSNSLLFSLLRLILDVF